MLRKPGQQRALINAGALRQLLHYVGPERGLELLRGDARVRPCRDPTLDRIAQAGLFELLHQARETTGLIAEQLTDNRRQRTAARAASSPASERADDVSEKANSVWLRISAIAAPVCV